jgi:exodeoxyribonuclease V alpha subunit
LGIVNGEMGTIKKINPEEKTAIIEFEYASKIIELKRSDLLHIRHAYAASCHKYQGSESPVIIALLTMAHYPLLYRSMLYTLITRGRELVTIVGDRKALRVATNNVKDNQRQTSLIELLQMKN